VRIDLAKLDRLVDMMEEHDLGELEIVDGDSGVSLEMAPRPRARRAPRAVETDDSGLTITSPRVGVFLRRAAVGDVLEEGGIVGEIRVMDVKYRVTLPAKGQVEEFLVEDGMGVEYGQPLVRLNLGRGEA
jgi:acetyl-CoA carboxylase biotin carboxyl carrier protein